MLYKKRPIFFEQQPGTLLKNTIKNDEAILYSNLIAYYELLWNQKKEFDEIMGLISRSLRTMLHKYSSSERVACSNLCKVLNEASKLCGNLATIQRENIVLPQYLNRNQRKMGLNIIRLVVASENQEFTHNDKKTFQKFRQQSEDIKEHINSSIKHKRKILSVRSSYQSLTFYGSLLGSFTSLAIASVIFTSIGGPAGIPAAVLISLGLIALTASIVFIAGLVWSMTQLKSTLNEKQSIEEGRIVNSLNSFTKVVKDVSLKTKSNINQSGSDNQASNRLALFKSSAGTKRGNSVNSSQQKKHDKKLLKSQSLPIIRLNMK